jgi:hypothetical protein
MELAKSGFSTEYGYQIDGTWQDIKLNWANQYSNSGNELSFKNTEIPSITVASCHGGFQPLNENSVNTSYPLGSEAYRWGCIYGVDGKFSGTIYRGTTAVHSSDSKLKNNIQLIASDSRYEKLYDSLQPVSYKLNDGTSGRTHTGLIAQELKQSILDAGLTTTEVAAYCEWDEENSETKEKTTTCGIRYGELIPLNIHEIQKLKKRVADQEVRITELEEIIKKLKTE